LRIWLALLACAFYRCIQGQYITCVGAVPLLLPLPLPLLLSLPLPSPPPSPLQLLLPAQNTHHPLTESC
jgi:hypothetical protein